jgi:hypothetical protein
VSIVDVTPVPLASILRVELFGAGPGLYLDLATSSFQVPTDELPWDMAETPRAKTTRATPNVLRTTRETGFIGLPIWERVDGLTDPQG